MPGATERIARHAVPRLAWLLVAAGAALLSWVTLVTLDARAVQREARRDLEGAALAALAPASSPAAANGILPPPPRLSASAVAALAIPRIALDVMVLAGSDVATLRKGPGHLAGTAMPGQQGNAVIAGHRDTFFSPLRHVAVGDDVFVETVYGRFHYRVTGTRVVHPRDLSPLEPTDEPALTLITCYPFWVLGNAPDRYIVRATRVLPNVESIDDGFEYR